MRTRRGLGLAAAGLALAVVVTGSGGLAAGPLAAFELLVVTAALLAASLPAPAEPRGPWRFGLALSAVAALSAALAPYVFASFDRWASWGCALLLAWTVARLESAAPDAATGRRDTGRLLLAAAIAVLALQALAVAGVDMRGGVETTAGTRGLGSFANPNHLSEMLVLLALALLPWVGLRRGPARLASALALLSAAAACLSGSRIAPLAVLAGLIALAATRRAASTSFGRRLLLAAAVAAVVVAGLAARSVASRFTEPDAWTRPRIWAAVAPATLERPLLGLGPGSFRHAHFPYNFPVEERIGRFAKRPSTPHGEWLRLPIELGAAGTLLLLGLAASCLRAPPPGRRLSAAAPWVAAVLPMALVHELFHAPAVAAWAAVALVASCPRERREGESPRALLSPARPVAAVAVLLPLLTAVLGLVLLPTWADRSARRGDLAAALRWNPHHAGYWMRAGRAAEQGTPSAAGLASAVLAYEEASRLSSRNPEPARRLAGVLAQATRHLIPEESSREAALAAWAEASRRSPRDPFLLAEAGSFLLGTGAPARAAALAERALELEPRFVDAALIAWVGARESGAEQAEAARRRAVRLLASRDELEERAGNDYERSLLRPRPELLRLAGLKDRTGR